MTRCLRFVMLAVGLVVAAAASASADSFTVDDWYLFVRVQNLSTSEYQREFFETVQNPFVNEHSVALPSDPATSAAAQYDISWLSNYGSFQISSQQQARGTASATVFTRAAGSLSVSVTQPMSLSIDAAWSYNLPADWMLTYMDVSVRAVGSSEFLFIQEYQRQTLPWEPASGTFYVQSDVMLSPDTWILSYSLELMADAGPGQAAVGSGYVNFSIPEPITLPMLLPLLFAIPRCRARRRIVH